MGVRERSLGIVRDENNKLHFASIQTATRHMHDATHHIAHLDARNGAHHAHTCQSSLSLRRCIAKGCRAARKGEIFGSSRWSYSHHGQIVCCLIGVCLMGGCSNDGEISRFRFAFLSVDRLANAASSMLPTRHTHDSMTMKDASCKCKHVLLLMTLARECTRFKNWLKGTCFRSADAAGHSRRSSHSLVVPALAGCLPKACCRKAARFPKYM